MEVNAWSSIKAGTGNPPASKVSWLSADSDWRPDRLESKAPIMFAMRRSPAATAFSIALGHVGDLLGSDGIFRMGSCSSEGGDVGQWKVELFLKTELVGSMTCCMGEG